MDKADEELRDTIRKLWPFQDMKQINLALPQHNGYKFLKSSIFFLTFQIFFT